MLPLVERYKKKIPPQSLAHVKRHWLTISFLLGFIIDNITLNNVEQVFDNLVILMYIMLSMTSMCFMYAAAAGKLPEEWNVPVRKYVPLVLQYAFGGLLSGMLIFYGRSGAWTESWPFLLVIIGIIAGNELIKDRVSRFLFNLTILFVGLFAYVVLIIPVLTGYMGPWIFLASGLLALGIMYGFIRILRLIIPNFITLQMRTIVFTLGIIYAGFNFLYFTNIIPPIPLSLKQVGIYHSVVKFETGEYQLKYEEGRWWQPFKYSDNVFHPTNGSVYCFASVFAPTRLATEIYHRWERYDDVQNEWVQHARLKYAIAGGRDQGYRGYTLIQNFEDGKWRCSVETGRGQVLGRETFRIDSSEPAAELTTRTE